MSRRVLLIVGETDTLVRIHQNYTHYRYGLNMYINDKVLENTNLKIV